MSTISRNMDGAERQAVMNRPGPRRVLDVLRAADSPVTAQGVADRLGVHHTGVRAHLKALVGGGWAEACVAPQQGRRGRPTMLYAAARHPDAQEAARHRDLVRTLVDLVGRLGLNADEMEAYGEGQAHQVCVANGGLGELSRAFARLGFAPEPVPGPIPNDLALRHCPFAAAVEVPGGHIVCALHLGLARGIASVADAGVVVRELDEGHPREGACVLHLDPAVRTRSEAAPAGPPAVAGTGEGSL